MDQNGRPLEIEEKVDFILVDGTLFKLSNEMLFYRNKNKEICQSIWIFIIHEKSIQQLLDTATKTELDALKTGSRKVVHKQLKQVPR